MVIKLFAVALLLGAAPVVGQQQSASQGASAAKTKNSDRIICEKIEQLGSRLGAKRVCMTARMWEEKRRIDREGVDDQQRKSYMPS